MIEIEYIAQIISPMVWATSLVALSATLACMVTGIFKDDSHLKKEATTATIVITIVTAVLLLITGHGMQMITALLEPFSDPISTFQEIIWLILLFLIIYDRSNKEKEWTKSASLRILILKGCTFYYFKHLSIKEKYPISNVQVSYAFSESRFLTSTLSLPYRRYILSVI